LSNKLTRSKPLQYYVEKNVDSITINLWPTPDDQETYQFGYYYMERVQDAGNSAVNNIDIPARFLPCLVSGLSYQLSMKYPAAGARAQALKADYEEQWTLASDSDRNKASLYVSPGGYSF
jgi:hypothetical protein